MKNYTAQLLRGFSLVLITLATVVLHTGCTNDSRAAEPANTSPTNVTMPVDSNTRTSPANAAAILAMREVPILCYHQIRDWVASDSRTARDYIVPIEPFRAQMQSLADSGYHTILPDQLYDYLVFGKTLPSKPVMISFDDTRIDQYNIALPALEQHGFKGVFFVMTVSLGRPGYMSKEQVRELSDKGHTIGSHTWDHHNVKKYAGEDWVTQIEKPSALLHSITGKPIEYFAYPFGLWNKEAIPELKRRGFKSVFQLATVRDQDDPLFTVRRIIVPGTWSGASLQKAMKNSFH